MSKSTINIIVAIAILTGGILLRAPKAAAAGIYHDPNPYVDYIIQRESSGRPWAVNYLGCAGLMQRCPGSLLGR
jgi:soluble lytic murein transglycosylase-like protein